MLYPRIKRIVRAKTVEWGNKSLIGFSTPVAKKLINFMQVNYPAIYEKAMQICEGYTLTKSNDYGFYAVNFKDYCISQDPYPRKPSDSQVIADMLWHLVCHEHNQFLLPEFRDFAHAYNKENFAFYYAEKVVQQTEFIDHDFAETVVVNTTPNLIDGYLDANLAYLKDTTAAIFKSVRVNMVGVASHEFNNKQSMTGDDLEFGLISLSNTKVRYVVTVVIAGKLRTKTGKADAA